MVRVYHLLSRALVTRGFVKTRERRQIRYDWVIDMSARLVYSVSLYTHMYSSFIRSKPFMLSVGEFIQVVSLQC